MSIRAPDTTSSVKVYLTDDEIARAFANRSDEEQVEILRAIPKAFDYTNDCEMQAMYIGKRLLSRASESGTMDAIRFLRLILSTCADDAEKVRDDARIPGEAP